MSVLPRIASKSPRSVFRWLHHTILVVCAVAFAFLPRYGYAWLLFGLFYSFALQQLDPLSQDQLPPPNKMKAPQRRTSDLVSSLSLAADCPEPTRVVVLAGRSCRLCRSSNHR
ncbi:hypothetical protein B0H14DRAFT_2820097 [Mycena olivaceomarginata]|nr:hypothetical protein B0H14DRAFT_2820097 [Mycena olivaceomarginata]